MSHFTKIRTSLKDFDILQKAMTRLGLTFQVGAFTVTQYGKSSDVQLKCDEAVGLACQEDGTYSMVGDFYHSRNRKLSKYYGNTNQFTADLSTAYAVEEATVRLEDQHFYCSENEEATIGQDGMIRMVFESFN